MCLRLVTLNCLCCIASTALAPKCQVDNLIVCLRLVISFLVFELCLQAELNRNALEINELRSRLTETESAASKAKKELQVSLKTAEDLKKYFEEERATFEVQKKDLEKRVQDAEGALNPVTEELTGLKRQIDLMTSAIFGKYNLNSCLSV